MTTTQEKDRQMIAKAAEKYLNKTEYAKHQSGGVDRMDAFKAGYDFAKRNPSSEVLALISASKDALACMTSCSQMVGTRQVLESNVINLLVAIDTLEKAINK